MMNTTTLKTLLVCAMLGSASLTNASTFSEVEKTCPVGGERFRYMAHNSYTTFGQMPDGMPIGTSLFPILPPICPGNGLIMFRDFSEDEVARLASFIATDDFTAMRQSETPMYIAARMAALLDGHDSPWMLLSATWEAKRDPIDSARAMRYQQSFIAAASNVSMPESLERVILLGRTANAQRELGDFDAARQTLIAASSMLERLPSPHSTGDYSDDDEDSRQAVRRYLQSLNAPIVRGDAARQPLDMADRMSAARRCLELGVQSRPEALESYEREVCQSEAVAEAITAMQRIRR